MNRRLLNLTAAALALACVAWLMWRWRDGRDADRARKEPPAAASPRDSAVGKAADARVKASIPTAVAQWLADLRRALSRREVRPGEAVLTFKDEAALQRFLDRAHASGLTLLGRLDALRSVRVRFDDFAALGAELARNAGDYQSAGANPLILIPQPPLREDRTGGEPVPFRNRTLPFLGATENDDWGRGVTIAVLDTGVASDATFGARLHTLDIGLGVTPGRGESDGHATGVAALAAGLAADARGVAPAANILSIRVTDTEGLSDLFTLSQAIVAAVDAGAKVVNVSLGGYAGGPVLDAALAHARERGATVVAAAGNDQAAQLAWPAADPRVISVGAVDAAEQQVSFSNSGEQLRLSAPGYAVQTAWLDSQRAYVSGTSASAPLVAGAIAAVLAQNPAMSAEQAAAVVVQTASDAGPPGTDPSYGQGILNVGWAMHRGDPAYVDTALAPPVFDPASNQVQFGVQNRSGRMVSGLSLSVSDGATSTSHTVPTLAPGETYVARVPVDRLALRSAGSLSFTSRLSNPPGVTDRVPANNERTILLRAPAAPGP